MYKFCLYVKGHFILFIRIQIAFRIISYLLCHSYFYLVSCFYFVLFILLFVLIFLGSRPIHFEPNESPFIQVNLGPLLGPNCRPWICPKQLQTSPQQLPQQAQLPSKAAKPSKWGPTVVPFSPQHACSLMQHWSSSQLFLPSRDHVMAPVRMRFLMTHQVGRSLPAKPVPGCFPSEICTCPLLSCPFTDPYEPHASPMTSNRSPLHLAPVPSPTCMTRLAAPKTLQVD